MGDLDTKLTGMTSGELWEVLRDLAGDTSDSASLVYEKALDALEGRVGEDKFAEICEKLEDLEDAS